VLGLDSKALRNHVAIAVAILGPYLRLRLDQEISLVARCRRGVDQFVLQPPLLCLRFARGMCLMHVS
jgi:hypothetical protein